MGARRLLVLVPVWLVSTIILDASPASAQPEPSPSDEPEPQAKEPQPRAQPLQYSNGWQLRPLQAPTGVRFDTVVGFYRDVLATGGRTVVSFVTATARVPGTGPPHLGLDLLVRAGYVTDLRPIDDRAVNGGTGSAFSNVLVGTTYSMRLPHHFLINFLWAVALPFGTGSGDNATKADMAARQHALWARSGFDVGMATNDVGLVPGVGIGWVSRGWTFQLEGTLAQLYRVRGETMQPDAKKTNLVVGFHAGYFVFRFASIGTEIRYNRWLVPPLAVQIDRTGASYDNATVAVGLRFHFRFGSGWLRPGVAYIRALDAPLGAAVPDLQVVQLDIPFVF